MTALPWQVEGLAHLGLAEIPGHEHNPTIRKMLTGLKAWWVDDETPWCGVFVAHCMRSCGVALPKHWYRAKDWAGWGVGLNGPAYGCVVVFERVGGGHVGIVMGRDQRGRLLVLGGNQGNKVSVAPFDGARAVAFRWPPTFPLPEVGPLLVATNNDASSSNEA